MKAEENTGFPYRKEGTKERSNVLITGMVIGFIILLTAGIVGISLSQKRHIEALGTLEHQRLELAVQLNQRDSIINQWVVAFDEIESDIMKITARENMLNLESKNPELSRDKKEDILKELAYVKTLIDQNKKKISSLNAQLRKSGIQIAALQARIDTLGNVITMRDNDIAGLKSELDNRTTVISQLNKKVEVMDSTITTKNSEITRQTGELNKGYVAYGTYKDLKEKGLVNKEGGVLGLGKKESLQENFNNDSLFTQIDISQTTTLPVNSKSVKLVTEHPANSYTLVKDDAENIAYIEIKDPATFWKLSKYAVVELHN